ncbi:MAG: NADH-quinone oxidoreductase subunit M [Proteobacteria bacterium]|jgi:NADH-quinone oxidoreductase subunit M|nr:NADH-quinone oxidoreductase subunit M [Pseudomonadota bacterium]
MDFLNHHVLSLLTFVPLLTAFAVLLSPSLGLARWVSMLGSLLTFLFSIHVWYYFDGQTSGLQFTEIHNWIPTFGIKYIMGVDGLNLLLVVLTAFLTPLILLSVWHVDGSKQKAFLALFMGLECGMLGSLVAFDLVFFYIFWEAMLIPMYFLIGIWGGKNRIYATSKFIIYTFAGSLLMLAAMIVLYILHFEQTGIYTTSLLDLYGAPPAYPTQMWLFAAFAIAFAIKVPVFPFHTWLPDAHTEAPTAGSVILAGVMLKLGTYGLVRFAIPLFPEAVVSYAPLIVGLGVIGIVYGALNAWMQTDAKRMVAYSSVSHLGFVVIGSFALVGGGAALSPEALTGAIYQQINHGISTGALFFLVGVIYERRHTRLLADFGGLAKVMPWFGVMLIVATLSSVGLPGTGGFVGEFLILLGTFIASPLAGSVASLGVLLGAIYMLTLCRKILFGPITHEENKGLSDLTPREFAYLTPLAILAIVMGVFPNLFLDKIRPSIENLANNYKSYKIVAEAPALNEAGDKRAEASH